MDFSGKNAIILYVRISLFPLSILLLLSLSGCSKKSEIISPQKNNPASGAMILRFADSSPEIHPSASASEYFARLVESKSQGKIKIKVYFDGKLGNEDAVLEQLKFGGIALGRVSFISLNTAVPALKDFSSSVITRPLFCRDKILEKMEFLSEKCLAEKLYPLSVFYPDKRCFYAESPKYFFNSLEGLKGLRVGTLSSDLIQNELEKYGAIPVDVVSADTYQSMQKGFMQVREGDLSDFILGKDYYFANYLMLSEYIANPSILVMSSEVWNKLSVEEKKIFRECAWEAALYQQTMMERFYTANLDVIKKNKEVVTLKNN